MPIRCRCDACQAQFRIDDKYAGKKARCPKCAQVVNVPQQSYDEQQVTTFPTVDAAAGENNVPTFPTVDQPRPQPLSKPPVFSPAAPPQSDSQANTVDVPGGFLAIDTASEAFKWEPSATPVQTAISGKAAELVGRRKRNSPLPLILGGSGAALLVLVVLVVVVVISRGKEGESSKADDRQTPSKTLLVYDWPVSERTGASLSIDGRGKRLPPTGAVQFVVEPGEHTVIIKRRGFAPIEQTVSLKAGERHRLRPDWEAMGSTVAVSGNSRTSAVPLVSLPGYEGWWQNIEKAKEIARNEKKDLLIAFVGSDWDRESQVLHQEVFASLNFQTIAQRYVRVVIDSPRTETGYNQLADAAKNKWVKRDYGVVDSRIPLVVLADEAGRPYVVLDGYDDDGGRNYLNRLSTLHQERVVRDALFAEVNAATGEAQLDAALKAAEWIGKNYVASFFSDEIEQWRTLAEQFDPTNAQGKHEAVFELQWMSRLIQANIEDDDRSARDVVAELDNWVKTRKLRDPNRGARMHLLAGMTAARSPAELQKHIEDALTYNPTDPELKAGLNSLKEFADQVASRVLGSGSGFVVGAEGYIVTNHHVIEQGGKPYVVLPGIPDGVPASVIARDPRRDMALLKIEVPEGIALRVLDISVNELSRGYEVAAFGYPLGEESLKATFGRISGLPSSSSEEMYVLDCIVNPGNSGGPLCDTRGMVIGMVTAKTRNFQPGVDSYGMALPAKYLSEFLQKNLTGFKPVADDRPKLEGWDLVDRLVSPSILMIQIKGG